MEEEEEEEEERRQKEEDPPVEFTSSRNQTKLHQKFSVCLFLFPLPPTEREKKSSSPSSSPSLTTLKCYLLTKLKFSSHSHRLKIHRYPPKNPLSSSSSSSSPPPPSTDPPLQKLRKNFPPRGGDIDRTDKSSSSSSHFHRLLLPIPLNFSISEDCLIGPKTQESDAGF